MNSKRCMLPMQFHRTTRDSRPVDSNDALEQQNDSSDRSSVKSGVALRSRAHVGKAHSSISRATGLLSTMEDVGGVTNAASVSVGPAAGLTVPTTVYVTNAPTGRVRVVASAAPPRAPGWSEAWQSSRARTVY